MKKEYIYISYKLDRVSDLEKFLRKIFLPKDQFEYYVHNNSKYDSYTPDKLKNAAIVYFLVPTFIEENHFGDECIGLSEGMYKEYRLCKKLKIPFKFVYYTVNDSQHYYIDIDTDKSETTNRHLPYSNPYRHLIPVENYGHLTKINFNNLLPTLNNEILLIVKIQET